MCSRQQLTDYQLQGMFAFRKPSDGIFVRVIPMLESCKFTYEMVDLMRDIR